MKDATRIAGSILIGIFVSLSAQAQRIPRGCTALVSVANDLYSARPVSGASFTGKLLSRFTSDGLPKRFVTFSPDGNKVAYVAGRSAGGAGTVSGTFHVVNESGQRGVFELDPGGRDVEASGQFAGGDPFLLDLAWDSDDVLRLVKWWGKDYARFEFRRIPQDLSGSAPEAAEPAVAESCALEGKSGPVACIDQGGFVTAGGVAAKPIYSVSAFAGVPVLESFDLHTGQSFTPRSVPDNVITIQGLSHDTVEVKIAPSDTKYPWSESFVKSGSYTEARDYKTWADYGYFATILNAKSGLVRIDIRRDNTPDQLVDRGLARAPNRRGLVFIRRTNTGAFLDLIRPGRGRGDAGHGVRGHGHRWHLAAQAPVSLAHHARSMQFLTPSLLLIDAGIDRSLFYLLPVEIGNAGNDGKPPLAAGQAILLPQTLAVSIEGRTRDVPVLGWSCKATNTEGDR